MKRILLASCVRQDEDIFKLFIESVNNLNISQNIKIDRLFYLHNSSHLQKYFKKDDIVQEVRSDDEYKIDEKTHYWQGTNLYNVTIMKNSVLDYANKMEYDYVFIIDSDLILHPDTLIHLLNAKKDIVSEIFWTRWTPNGQEMPNAWDIDHYSFYKGTLAKYRQKGLYKCGGTGACILISKNVINAGVNFNPVTNISFWGEDRAFQIRANVAGFEMYVDTHTPCFHIYRQSYLDAGKKFLEALKNEKIYK